MRFGEIFSSRPHALNEWDPATLYPWQTCQPQVSSKINLGCVSVDSRVIGHAAAPTEAPAAQAQMSAGPASTTTSGNSTENTSAPNSGIHVYGLKCKCIDSRAFGAWLCFFPNPIMALHSIDLLTSRADYARGNWDSLHASCDRSAKG
jgi:hypothetical protein